MASVDLGAFVTQSGRSFFPLTEDDHAGALSVAAFSLGASPAGPSGTAPDPLVTQAGKRLAKAVSSASSAVGGAVGSLALTEGALSDITGQTITGPAARAYLPVVGR